MIIRSLIAVALLAFAASPVPAAEPTGVRLDDAWDDAIGGQEKILTDAQFARLNTLAFQAAVVQVCKGFALDDEKFAAEFAAVMVPPSDALTPDELKQWEAAVLIRFGTVYGLFIAEGNGGEQAFCAGTEDLLKDPKVPVVLKVQ